MVDERNKTYDGDDFREKTAEERYKSLPVFLQRALTDPRKLQEIADNQRDWAERHAAASPFLGQTPQTARYQQAQRELPDWQDARTLVQSELMSAVAQRDAAEVARLTERFQHYSRLVADTLSILGYHEEAASIHPDERRSAELQLIHDAVCKDDAETCGPECEARFLADPSIVSRERVLAEVYSLKHGQVMPVNVCSMCGTANARPLSAELSGQRQARQKAIEMTRHQSPAQAQATLFEAELTSAKVFKL